MSRLLTKGVLNQLSLLDYSVQRGIYTWTGGIGTDTINLPTNVVKGKSFVIVSVATADNDVRDTGDCTTTVELDTEVSGMWTQLTLKRGRTSGATQVHWQVVEGEAFSVQTGEIAMSTVTSNTGSISAIDQSNTFLVISHRGSAIYSSRQMCRARFSDNSTISVDRDDAGGDAYVRYFAVTIEGATVQSFDVTLSGTSQTQAITSVTQNDSFLSWSMKNGEEARSAGSAHNAGVRGKFNSSTEIQFNRAGSIETVTITVFVVEWSSQTVQHVAKAEAFNQYYETATMTAVDTAKSFTINHLFGSGYISVGGDQDLTVQPMHMSRITGSTNLRADFGDVSSFGRKSDVNFQVVSL